MGSIKIVFKPIEEGSAALTDDRRWQGKEYDEEQGKYYFGARYFDSFFGLWMSPDPAGQFANPYTYGGDPVNFIDPTGMFSFGVGLVVGWDENHGWNWGFGSSLDLSYKGTNYSGVGSFNLSYTWSQDGSSTFDIGASGSWQWYIFNFNAGLSYSYNSYTGSVLSTQGGVCIGNAQIACAGIENGYSAYWDSYGNFVGATTFVELYAQVAGGIGRASAGYEWGLLGMEGRDFYVGANVAGIHGELSHIGGGDGKKMDASWGFEEKFYYKL